MKSNLKKKIIAFFSSLTICFMLIGLIAVILVNKTDNNNKQQEVLTEIEKHKGEYAEDTIVLNNTNKVEAEKIANKLNATLRISNNGKFATLKLRDGMTIADVYKNNDYIQYFGKFSLDYKASISDIKLDEDEEETLSKEKLPSAPLYTSNETDYNLQTYLNYINLQNTWGRTKGRSNGSGTKVAIIDTGIDIDNIEFINKISEKSYNATYGKVVKDYTTEDGSYDWSLIDDKQGHGTGVAGVIAASENGSGIMGIAPEIDELIIIKAECDENGNFYNSSDLVFGLLYAIEMDVDVVNMSFGGYFSNPYKDAAKLAVDSDITLVAAAGNDATSQLCYPAADPNVIGVGALADDSFELATYSNYGDNVDIVAPGTTYTTQNDGTYGIERGTSLAAPIVTAAIALYYSQNLFCEVSEIKEMLYASSYDLGNLGKDFKYGYGALDISALVIEEKCKVTFDMLTDELDDIEQIYVKNHTLQNLPEPERNYAIFDGWYYDIHCVDELNWYEDIFSSSSITLYANWVNEEDGIPYTYVTLPDDTIEIRSYTGRRKYLTIPNTIEDKVVSSIGDEAFLGQSKIREITLPDGLVNIGNRAFYQCSNLLEIEIPSKVKTIGEEAFYDNVRLSNIIFDNQSELETINSFAFSNCGNLEVIELPKNLINIDGTAFVGDMNLYSIKVNEENNSYLSDNGILYNKTKSNLIAYPAGKNGVATIPNVTSTIGDYAFAYYDEKEINLNNVNTIGNYAFIYSKLESLDLVYSIVQLGRGAFLNNIYLNDVTIGNNMTTIPDYCFENDEKLTNILIPSNITSIGANAFKSTNLTNISFALNSNLQIIGESSFLGTKIETIEFPKSLISIGENAFKDCFSLKNVTFEANSSLLSIGSYAFSKYEFLENETFIINFSSLDNLIQIGDYAFMNSSLDGDITLPASLEYLGEGAFANNHNLENINVDLENNNYVSLYGVVYNKNQDTIVEYPSGKENIEYNINDSVTTIGPAAFYGAYNLTNIILPNDLLIINKYGFYECINAETYNLPHSLTEIHDYAFSYNLGLKKLFIPKDVTNIGKYVFAHDSNLEYIEFDEESKLSRIGFATFAYTSIKNLTIPASVTSIAQYAFEGSDIQRLDFASNSKLEYISAYNFDGCNNLGTIVFGKNCSLNNIEAHAFENSGIRNIDFSNTKLTNIDNYAFRYCDNLTNIILPEGVNYIGRYAFFGCSLLDEIHLPSTIDYIGRYAFNLTNNINVYFDNAILPNYLQEDWDYGINDYYLGVSEIKENDNYRYAILDGNNIAILEYKGQEETINLLDVEKELNLTIKQIGGYAFYNTNLKNITLPNNLENIQRYAFAYTSLENIEIPNTVDFIGQYAFYHTPIKTLTFVNESKVRVIEQSAFERCDNLQNVSLPNSITQLGRAVFKSSGLTSLLIGEGIQTIPAEAFQNTNITDVVIPNSVTKIEDNAFRNTTYLANVTFGTVNNIELGSNVFYNSGLKSLYIPKNLTYIGEFSFTGLTNLLNFEVDVENQYYAENDGLLYSKNMKKLIAVPAGRKGHLDLPESLEVIGFGAFENSNLESVSFNENSNILSLGNRSFFNAKKLKTITIPSSVVAIDFYAFAYCDSLTTVIFNEGSKLKGIYEGAFYSCKNLSNIEIPNSVVEISDFAFYGCINLTKLPVSENNNLKGIYDYALAYTNIEDLYIPESVIDIGNYAFMGSKVKNVTIPDENKKQLIIGIGAFEDCNLLDEITLPFIGASFDDEEITWFGYIFGAGSYQANQNYMPENLKVVTITEGLENIRTGAFYEIDTLEQVNLPYSIIAIYDNSFDNTTFKYELYNEIEFIKKNLDGTETILNCTLNMGTGLSGTFYVNKNINQLNHFSHNTFLEYIIFNEECQIEMIDQSLFYGCSSLKSIIIPDEVTIIRNNAFSNCSSLTSVVLTNNSKLQMIEEEAFQNCTSLKEFNIPSSVSYIGEEAFSGCKEMQDFSLIKNESNNLQNIAENSIIEQFAFRYCLSLENVEIPNSITTIGDGAFYECSSLQSITIPNSVTTIGANAFYNCSSLQNITIPSGVTSIENSIFYGCSSLESIVIPNSVKSIEEYAFYNCSSLQNITIPSSVTSIKNSIFFGCNSLEKINLEKIDTWLKIKFDYPHDNPLFAYNTKLYLNNNEIVDLIIPSNINTIGQYAFSNSTSLRSITFDKDSQLQSIEDYAFENCISLESIEIPNSVTCIGNGAFSNCSSLRSITFDKDSQLQSIEDYAFEYCSSLEKINLKCIDTWFNIEFKNVWSNPLVASENAKLYVNDIEQINITIPDGIDEIKPYVLYDVDSIESVVISDDVTKIGNCSFLGCDSLSTIILNDTSKLEIIEESAFAHCKYLSNITIPKNVTTIENDAFLGCNLLYYINNLSNLPIEKGVDNYGRIAQNAHLVLDNNNSLDDILDYKIIDDFLFEIKKENDIVTNYLIAYLGSEKEITLPSQTNDFKYEIYYFSNNVKKINIQEGTTNISDKAFVNCTTLESITLPNSVTSIGAYAFYNCSSLESITIPKNVNTIGQYAFSSCSSLTNIVIPSSVMNMGECVFANCNSLTIYCEVENKPIGWNDRWFNDSSLKIYWNMENPNFFNLNDFQFNIVGDNVYIYKYFGNDSIISIPNTISYNNKQYNITEISDNAFENCTSLVNVTIAENITIIGANAFKNCSSLEKIEILSTIYLIKNNTFEGCSSLQSIKISNKIASIGDSAFKDCSSLEKIIFEPESQLHNIGFHTFEGCISLISIDIPNSVTYIGDSAFLDCISLENVTINCKLNSLNNLFVNCKSLNNVKISTEITSINGTFENCTSLINIEIPNSVTIIGISSFKNCTSLIDIEIPNNVTSIGTEAFKDCISLQNVTFKEDSKLQYIGELAFVGCSSLQNIIIPNSVKNINVGVFQNCTTLKSITLPNDITILENFLFKGCTSLIDIKIPNTVESIGDLVFYECQSLQNINIPNNVISIGKETFFGCTSLENIILSNSIEIIDNSLFEGCTKLQKIDIPSNVASIGDAAFRDNTSLTDITINEDSQLQNIGKWAFENCQSLSKIKIPNSVTNIGYGAFYMCNVLHDIYIDSIESWLNINFEDENLHSNPLMSNEDCRLFIDNLELENITIPTSVSYIGVGAFRNLTSIKSITIPNNVINIGNYAFDGCRSLTNVIFEPNYQLENIGTSAFRNCSSLQSIDIPDSVTSIGEDSFFNCSSLENVELPSELTSIGAYAFYNCNSLKTITIPSHVNNIGYDAFRNCSLVYVINHSDLKFVKETSENGCVALSTKLLLNKNESLDDVIDYKLIDNFLYEIFNDDGKIINRLISYIGNEKEITLPKQTDSFKYEIHDFNSNVKKIIIPLGTTNIGDHAFSSIHLETIEVPDSVISIGNEAFSHCYSLKNIKLPETITYIGKNAFTYTAFYNDINNWQNGKLYLGNYLIDASKYLEFEKIDSNVKVIANEFFKDSYNIKSLEIDGKLLHENSLKNLSNIKTLIIHNSLNVSLEDIFGHNIPLTLENIILRNNFNLNGKEFINILDRNKILKIFVEDENANLMWDDLYPNWNNGNTVYYGGEWINVTFYDENNNIISSDYYTTSQVIRIPYYEINKNQEYSYELVGWDIDNDGSVDSIPATSNINIAAHPIISQSTNKYTVRFYDLDQETILYSYLLPYGSNFSLPEDIPTKKGYKFIGWQGYNDEMIVTSDINIYSIWEHLGDSKEHVYDLVETVEPTCDGQGYTKHICSICGDWYPTDYQDPKGHSYGSELVENPTCTTDGYKYYECSECQHREIIETIPTNGHQYENWDIDFDATCTTDGQKHRQCSECSNIEYEIITKLGHDYQGHLTKESTCTTKGKITYKCSRCENEIVEELPLKEHKYVKKLVSKSWIRWLIDTLLDMFFGYEGNQAYYFECQDCHHIQTSKEMKLMTSAQSVCIHEFGEFEEQLAATCEEQGIEGRKCIRCGQIVDAITKPALGHIYQEHAATSETCTDDGNIKYYTCEKCDKYFVEDEYGEKVVEQYSNIEIKAHGHSWKLSDDYEKGFEWSDDGTTAKVHFVCEHDSSHIHEEKAIITSQITQEQDCEQVEITTYTAKYNLNGQEYTSTKVIQTKDALVHSWKLSDDYEKGFEWSDDGTTAKVHFVCEHNSSHTHEEDAIVTSQITQEQSCEQVEITTFIAKVKWNEYQNGKDFTATKIVQTKDAKGHNFVEHQSKDATCEENGNIKYFTCDDCNKFFNENKVVINELDTIIKALGHKESDWIIDKESTCKEEGSRHTECERCHKTIKTEPISLKNHTISDWIIDVEPTKESEGSKHKECLDCGTILETETIEKLPKKESNVGLIVGGSVVGAVGLGGIITLVIFLIKKKKIV